MEIYKFIFSPIEVNTYILADQTGDCAIIDCGCYDNYEFERLEVFIKDKNLNPVLLLNTHCHLDHIFGNKYILERYKLKSFFSQFEEPNRKNSVQHAMLFGLHMDNPPEPEGYIADNQIITFGSIELVALHVPGHSPGGLAFYSEKDGCVITGDALFSGSIGRSDLPGGNYDDLIESIRSRLLVLPPSTVVYPGHGDETTIGREMKSNPYLS